MTPDGDTLSLWSWGWVGGAGPSMGLVRVNMDRAIVAAFAGASMRLVATKPGI